MAAAVSYRVPGSGFVCAYSRSSITTGRAPHYRGVWTRLALVVSTVNDGRPCGGEISLGEEDWERLVRRHLPGYGCVIVEHYRVDGVRSGFSGLHSGCHSCMNCI